MLMIFASSQRSPESNQLKMRFRYAQTFIQTNRYHRGLPRSSERFSACHQERRTNLTDVASPAGLVSFVGFDRGCSWVLAALGEWSLFVRGDRTSGAGW